MKRILFTLMTLAAVLSVAGVGSLAYFSDIETSTGNTFTAGTLDLKVWHPGRPHGAWVDEPNIPPLTSTAYWDSAIDSIINNLKPGDEGTITVPIRNDGSVDGIAQLQFTGLVDWENGCNEPECIAEGGTWVCDGYGGGYGGGHGRHCRRCPPCPPGPPWPPGHPGPPGPPWPPCPPGPCQCEDCDSCGDPGPGEGELSQYLDVVIKYGNGEKANGTLYNLVAGGIINLGELAAGEEEDVVMVFSIDYDYAGNIIQSDSVDFNISFELIQPEP